MKKYRLTFDFAETEEKAREMCDAINKRYTYYMRKNNPAHYTPWSPSEGESNYHFVVWYQV
jgi:hypothetical protein